MEPIVVTFWKSPLGWIGLAANSRGLVQVTVPRSSQRAARAAFKLSAPFAPGENDHTRAAQFELARYFACDPRADLDALVLDTSCGTPFEQAVWQRVRAIPRGETRTYGEIAREVGRPLAARAVGACNAKNPWAIIVPCHRLIGSNGDLVGYEGGLAMKERLLKLEGVDASARKSTTRRGARDDRSPGISAFRAKELAAAGRRTKRAHANWN